MVDPAVSPEVAVKVLELAAEMHTEELTRLRRSELIEAAVLAGIPERYVSAALEKVEPALTPKPATAPQPAPAAANGSGDLMFFLGYIGFMFVLGLASAWLADLLEPWASPLGMDRASIAVKLLVCGLIWLVGAFVGMAAAVAVDERRQRKLAERASG